MGQHASWRRSRSVPCGQRREQGGLARAPTSRASSASEDSMMPSASSRTACASSSGGCRQAAGGQGVANSTGARRRQAAAAARLAQHQPDGRATDAHAPLLVAPARPWATWSSAPACAKFHHQYKTLHRLPKLHLGDREALDECLQRRGRLEGGRHRALLHATKASLGRRALLAAGGGARGAGRCAVTGLNLQRWLRCALRDTLCSLSGLALGRHSAVEGASLLPPHLSHVAL